MKTQITESVENKNIKSFNQLPLYILDSIKEMNNTYRESKFEYGGEVVNSIKPNTNQRWIYEVEYLCNNKTLNNSRILWCVVSGNYDMLSPMGLGKDVGILS